MDIKLYISVILIFFLFYISNFYILNKKEHFINLYQYLNDNLEKKPKENNKDFTINRNFKKFNDL